MQLKYVNVKQFSFSFRLVDQPAHFSFVIQLHFISVSEMLLSRTLLICCIFALFIVCLLYRFNPSLVSFAFYLAQLCNLTSIVVSLFLVLEIIL